MRFLIFILVLACSNVLQAQKVMDWQDLMKFKKIQKVELSRNASFLISNEVPDRGDGVLKVYSLNSDKVFQIERGTAAQHSDDGKIVVAKVLAKSIEIENETLGGDKVKSGIAILNTQNGDIKNIEQVESFELNNSGKWLIYKLSSDKKADKNEKNKKTIGASYNLRHIESGTEIIIPNILEYKFDSTAKRIFYSISTSDGKDDGIFFRKLDEAFAPELKIMADSACLIQNLTWLEATRNLAFTYAELEKDGKGKDAVIYTYSENKSANKILSDSTNSGWYIPNKNDMRFSDDGKSLFFGFKPYSEKIASDDEKNKYADTNFYDTKKILSNSQLYLWHPEDGKIITQKRSEWNKTKDKTYAAIFDLVSGKYTQLCDTLVTNLESNKNSNFAALYSSQAYQKLIMYDDEYYDLYSVNLKNGEKHLVTKKFSGEFSLSPNGNYIAYYIDKNWHLFDNRTKKTLQLTNPNLPAFYDEEIDVPMAPWSYGRAGWMENDKAVLLYDQYDVWKFDTQSGKAENITKGEGRKNKLQIRFKNLDNEKVFYGDKDEVIVMQFHKKLKYQSLGIFSFKSQNISTTQSGEYFYNPREKAKYSDRIIYTREKFEEFPDIWLSDMKLKSSKKITNLGEQTKDYIWGTNELFDYTTEKGDTLQGFIIKPSNYVAGKKYPVLVYFYEQFSDQLYRWAQPAVNHRPSYQLYLGSGYIIYMADVKYYDGVPGRSSLESILPGCQKLIDMGIADKDKFCMQGHSWSGYQSAWIATQSNFFKSIVSGAPVGNMTSAYSGIRTESGRARQFQYEKAQSRIGGTMIDSLQRFIDNSPVFFANNMNTPMLIFHGDVDEAVPYQQGVELFLSMKRYGKPCFLLQYENEPHHPRKYHNKLDYAMKMKEFFDYYTLGIGSPAWITSPPSFKGTFTR